MNRSYRGTGDAAGWTTQCAYIAGVRTTEVQLRADLRDKPGAAFLQFIDPAGGELLGCVWLEPVRGGVWYLGSLTVAPDRQNSGLGRSILREAEAWLGARGGRRVRLTVVHVRNTLIAWYIRRGYRLTGETAPFPYDDERFGKPLRDDLHFVVLEKTLGVGLIEP